MKILFDIVWEHRMAKCNFESKSIFQCTETRVDTIITCTQVQESGLNQCTATADQGHDQCNDWRDEGINQCNETADQGYNKCTKWNKWFSWLCIAFVWVSNVVCVGWYWVANWVCHSWVWISNVVCVSWVWVSYFWCASFAWITYYVCVAWAYIVVALGWICCADPTLSGLFSCLTRTKDFPRNPLNKPGWTLTFEDDFDSGVIDSTKWIDYISFLSNRLSDESFGPLSEADFAAGKFPTKYYSPNFTFGPSTVKLIASNIPTKITIPIDPSDPTKWAGEFWVPYTVQALQWLKDPLHDQLYGYFEIRCKSQNASDMWPAFWLYPEGAGKQWPPEIDIFEFMSRDSSVFSTTQHWGQDPGHPSEGARHRACEAATRFHIYACEWNATEIKWYLDN